MLLVAAPSGGRWTAAPERSGWCPTCASPMVPKCGEIVQHHWAHEAGGDCDPWSEHETPWHRAWKEAFPEAWREVVVGPHRADVRRPDGLVLELQHSPISPDEIREREAFYRPMAWVFDVRDAWADGRFDGRTRDGFVTFRWKHPRKTVAACQAPVFLDTGAYLFDLRRIHTTPPCGGWGHRADIGSFQARVLAGGRIR